MLSLWFPDSFTFAFLLFTFGLAMNWHITGRTLPIGARTLIMGVLNVTPDSFSDGAQFLAPYLALQRAEQMIEEGADIIDVGGESTRPGSVPVAAEEEIRRVIPVIEELSRRTTTPISVDTTKSVVAAAALEAGAAIVNDISGLRFDPELATEAAKAGAGLVLMHSRGTHETLHRLPPVDDIMREVIDSLRNSSAVAEQHGVARQSIVIDPGIGFGKARDQNIELIAKLDRLVAAFPEFPILIGTSRKSFLGHLLNDAPVHERLNGTLASVTASILNGAHIVRVHDVKATADTVRVTDAIKRATK